MGLRQRSFDQDTSGQIFFTGSAQPVFDQKVSPKDVKKIKKVETNLSSSPMSLN